MHTLQTQLRTSIITGSLVILGVTVAVALAGPSESLQVAHLLHSFVLAQPNDLRDPVNPLAGASFDLVAYMAHPCYNIVGMEKKMCEDQYGLTESLRSLLESGRVVSYLKQRGLLAAEPPTSSTPAPVATAPAPTPTYELNSTLYHKLLVERGKILWSACRARAGSWKEANHCYARNTRLLSRFNVPIQGNVY